MNWDWSDLERDAIDLTLQGWEVRVAPIVKNYRPEVRVEAGRDGLMVWAEDELAMEALSQVRRAIQEAEGVVS